LKLSKMAESSCKLRVCFDMNFDDLMTQRDLGKCLKQVMRCYSINRRLPAPLQLSMTSFAGKVVEEMGRHEGYRNWDMDFQENKFDAVFSKDDIVYLSSESENVLQQLDQDKVYIIGGLVDHNRHKGLCHSRAVAAGVSHAKLPIGEFVNLASRKVLTIDHVFQILVKITQGLSWKEAFLAVIPGRKGVAEKETEEQHKSSVVQDNIEAL